MPRPCTLVIVLPIAPNRLTEERMSCVVLPDDRLSPELASLIDELTGLDEDAITTEKRARVFKLIDEAKRDEPILELTCVTALPEGLVATRVFVTAPLSAAYYASLDH